MTGSGLKPGDLETIAAFIDRRLPEEERRAFQERLEREEALYEVFIETVRYRDQQTAGEAVVIEHPASRGRWNRWAAVAALVAVAVATPLVLRNLDSPRYAESLVAEGRFDPPSGSDWYEQGWSRTRGVSAMPERNVAFRTGVQAIDLEVALRLGLERDAAGLAARLESTLYSLPLADAVQASYSELRERLEAGEATEGLLDLARSAEEAFDAGFPELASAARLGRWAESGKLAARSGQRELLSSRPFARDLRDLRRPEEAWDPAVAAELETIEALLDASEAELDLAALEDAFQRIIDAA